MYLNCPEKIEINSLRIADAASALYENCLHFSDITKRTNLSTWNQFSEWTANLGLLYVRDVTPDVVGAYVKELIIRENSDELNSHTVQTKVACINAIMKLLFSAESSKEWEPISARSFGLHPRSTKRNFPPDTLRRDVYQSRLDKLALSARPHELAVVEICREFGFTISEASQFDASKDWRSAKKKPLGSIFDSYVHARDIKKGPFFRCLKITTNQQYLALERAAKAQGTRHHLMDNDKTINKWKEQDLRTASKIMGGLEELRAAYACERFSIIAGYAPPCAGGNPSDKDQDIYARRLLASELGIKNHGNLRTLIG